MDPHGHGALDPLVAVDHSDLERGDGGGGDTRRRPPADHRPLAAERSDRRRPLEGQALDRRLGIGHHGGDQDVLSGVGQVRWFPAAGALGGQAADDRSGVRRRWGSGVGGGVTTGGGWGVGVGWIRAPPLPPTASHNG